MVDKTQSVPRNKIGKTLGRFHDDTMLSISRALALFLGFA